MMRRSHQMTANAEKVGLRLMRRCALYLPVRNVWVIDVPRTLTRCRVAQGGGAR